MVKRAQRISSNQHDLFQQLDTTALDDENARALDLEVELRGSMAAALRQARQLYGFSREIIVDRMNHCLDEDSQITIRKLNAWTAASKEDHHAPAAWLPAFCWATRSIAPFQVLLNPLDFEAVDSRDQRALRLGLVAVEKARLAREESSLKQSLRG